MIEHGYRGPVDNIDVDDDYKEALAKVEMPKGQSLLGSTHCL